MAERSVPQIMSMSYSLYQVHIQPQGPGDGLGDLVNFQGMGEAGSVMLISLTVKYLRLTLEPAEGIGV